MCAAALAVIASPAAAAEPVWVPARWTVVAVAAHERSLELRIATAGRSCGEPELRATVRETPTDVGISIVEAETPRTTPGLLLACPAIARVYSPPSLSLDAPLAGRRIYALPTSAGPLPEPAQTLHYSGLAAPGRVPRVIGFAPVDAKHALEAADLCERIHVKRTRHGLPRVLAQTPSPGTPIPYVTSSDHPIPRCGLVSVQLAA